MTVRIRTKMQPDRVTEVTPQGYKDLDRQGLVAEVVDDKAGTANALDNKTLTASGGSTGNK